MNYNLNSHLYSPTMSEESKLSSAIYVYIFSADGQRYLDFTCDFGVTSAGLCHPEIVSAA
jgi:4-aminobutyrate aminotransferase-like enzyme